MNIPFEDNAFDSIVSFQVFEHVEDLERCIKELKRVIRPKGKMMITLPFINREHMLPYDFRRWTCNGINNELAKHGFSVLETKKLSNMYTILATCITWKLKMIRRFIAKTLILFPFYMVINFTIAFIINIFGIFFSSIPGKEYYSDIFVLCELSEVSEKCS